MRRNPWRIVWGVVLVVVVAVELVTVALPDRGDTLSEQVWDLLAAAPWLAFPLAGLLIGLLLHFLAPRLEDRLRSWWRRGC